jgi:hypothetical protein
MQTARVIIAAMAVTASGLMTMSAAEARHYRHAHAYSDDALSETACGPIPPPSTLSIYPESNWEPFFRRHVYRYGPLVVCTQAAAGTDVISVHY